MGGQQSALEVRLVVPGDADLDAIASLVNRAFRTHPIMKQDRTDAGNLADEAGPEGIFVVVQRDSQIVGSAMVRPIGEHDGGEGYLPPATALYFGIAAVEPDSMGGGVGRLLLRETERIARERGNTHLSLSTIYEFGLVPYYERFGCKVAFVESFDATHYDLGQPHHLCHLEKAL